MHGFYINHAVICRDGPSCVPRGEFIQPVSFKSVLRAVAQIRFYSSKLIWWPLLRSMTKSLCEWCWARTGRRDGKIPPRIGGNYCCEKKKTPLLCCCSIIQEVCRENGSYAIINPAWQLNPVIISTGRREELQIKVWAKERKKEWLLSFSTSNMLSLIEDREWKHDGIQRKSVCACMCGVNMNEEKLIKC